jgi:hypothetical protein
MRNPNAGDVIRYSFLWYFARDLYYTIKSLIRITLFLIVFLGAAFFSAYVSYVNNGPPKPIDIEKYQPKKVEMPYKYRDCPYINIDCSKYAH